MKAPAFWSGEQPGALARILSSFGLLYGAVAARKMARPGVRVGVPVVTIGNFVAGGAGKTPTALAVARLLIARGERPAFVSRGYGGTNRGPVRVDNQSARDIGDEPLLLARIAPTFVGVDRVAAARLAVADVAPSVLVLDDGLQSRRIEPDVALAVVDGATGIGNGLCLPAGPMRAPLAAQIGHVSAVVVIGAGEAGDRIAREAKRAGKPVFRATFEPDESARALRGRKVVAFAGIGRPEKLFATLEQIGADIVGRRAFADHHDFNEQEIAGLATLAAQENAMLVATEKDLARLGDRALRRPVTAVAITLSFEQEHEFMEALAARLGRSRTEFSAS